MRVKLSNPALLRGLLAEFAFDANVVVTQLADDEVEVSFLGSLNASAQQMETELPCGRGSPRIRRRSSSYGSD